MREYKSFEEDTAPSGSRKSRSPLRWIIPLVIILALLAAAAFLASTRYVFAGGKLYSRNTKSLDLRSEEITAETFDKLAAAMPDCTIEWNVPIAGTAYPNSATELTLASLPEKEIRNLRYFKQLAFLDLTAADITADAFDDVVSEVPQAEVRWSIPIGAGKYLSDAEDVVLSDFNAEEAYRFGYFTNLKTADASGCSCYEALLQAARQYPKLSIFWNVPVGGASFPQDAEEITLESASVSSGEAEEKLGYLPNLKNVKIKGSCTAEKQQALEAAYPDLIFYWPVLIDGTEYLADTTEISLAGKEIDSSSYEELRAGIAKLPALAKVDVTGTNLTQEQVFTLIEENPSVDIVWTFSLYGVEISTMDTLVDFTGIPMENTEAVEAVMPFLRHLEKVDMSYTGFDDETLDAMNKRFDNVRVVWTMDINPPYYYVRTDDVGFIGSFEFYGILSEESIQRFKYCPDMICADFGHRITFQDTSIFYEMPQLQYLLLADCWAQDITSVGSLENLIYFEMVLGFATDLSPLLNCKNLKDLNVCYCIYTDPETNFEVFSQMTQLERLFYSEGMIPADKQAELEALLPNTQIQVVHDKIESTAYGWRYHERYYTMRDLLGAFYMKDVGGRQYSKIIDGVEYPLSEEFIASQRNVVHGRHHIDIVYE